jgi:catechol 2,3-dioxygenase-like lactoylglutathione lyase family enzyme
MTRRTGAVPSITGIHHVRLPIADVLRSRDWYMDVFGFGPMLAFEEEDRLVGVALEHPCGVTLGLHLEPERAVALSGFAALALCVGDLDTLRDWRDRLAAIGVEYSPILEGHIGWSIEVRDPDGILVQLHTRGHPTADDT